MKFLKYWGPVFLWMAVIFFFSSRQRVSVSPDYLLNFLFFKSLHIGEYLVLYVLSYRAISSVRSEAVRKRRYGLALAFLLLSAGSDEFHQSFVPTREPSVRDVIIDVIGGLLAWTSISTLLPRMPQKLQRLARLWGVHA